MQQAHTFTCAVGNLHRPSPRASPGECIWTSSAPRTQALRLPATSTKSAASLSPSQIDNVAFHK